MAKLSVLVTTTADQEFRSSVVRALRSSGVPLGVVEERDSRTDVPDLVVVDIRGEGSQGLQSVERLRAKWSAVCIFAVAGSSEPDVILQAMRAGANEFLAWPTTGESAPRDTEGFCSALTRIVERLQAARGNAASTSKTFAFFGAKGGAGTTTLAVNCAAELARVSKRPTIIIDFNPFVGEVALFLGVRPRFTLLDAADNMHRLDDQFLRELVAKHKSGLDILAGSDAMDRPNGQDGSALEELLQWIGRSHEFVVIDAGNLTNPCAEVAVFASDSIFLVANPDVPSIRNAQRVVDRMEDMGAGKDRIKVLLNRTSERHIIAPKQIEDALGHPIDHAFQSDYGTVSAALNSGVPVALSKGSLLATQLVEFTRGLAGLPMTVETSEIGRSRASLLGLF
ncbi:MAG: AAA family ATPase [Vicinamibacterales bacterium]|jgi:pilus assembly protein CpaE|nr:AAA family ATPase [Vicinamibacterales bacterium]